MELIALDLCHVVFDGIGFIAPLYWGVNDVLQSLSDLFIFLACIFDFPVSCCWFSVYAICCLNVCIWIAYVVCGRCNSGSMMV